MAVIRVSKFWPAGSAAPADALPPPRVEIAEDSRDGLTSFGSETGSASGADTKAVSTASRRSRVLAIVAAVLCCALSAAAAAWAVNVRAGANETGSLTLQTTPAGLDVLIDGTPHGRTPLTATLSTGPHAIQIGSGPLRRDLSVSVVGGASLVHTLEFSTESQPVVAQAAAPAFGALRIQTDPPKQAVTVDGVNRGVSPVTIDGLSTGEHHVVVRGPHGAIERSVSVAANQVVALVIAPVASTTPLPGWLAVASPVTLQMKEDGRLIGTTETERLMLPAGDHAIEFVNEALGYRSTRTISVAANKTTTFRVDLPTASLSLNALPWAEVWIDGERIGETPLANLSRVIGSHDVLFKHPQFGERRETVVVGLRQPARLGVDMRSQRP